MRVSFYWRWAVERVIFNLPKKKLKQCLVAAFTNAVTIYKVKLIFPLSMIKIWLFSLLEFEMDRIDKHHFKTKKKVRSWKRSTDLLNLEFFNSLETSKLHLTELWIFLSLRKMPQYNKMLNLNADLLYNSNNCLTYHFSEFEWTPALPVKLIHGYQKCWKQHFWVFYFRNFWGSMPQTPLGSSCLQHLKGALQHQEKLHPVVSEICPLL